MFSLSKRRPFLSRPIPILAWLSILLLCGWVQADDGTRRVHVYVALCDNATQGIVKVGEAIGNGDDPDRNLYWGCSDGLKLYFKNSSKWSLSEHKEEVSEVILEQMTFRHTDFKDVELVAYAYRGSEMRQCMTDFFAAISSKEHPADLVAFIGHNGLMDFRMTTPEVEAGAPERDVVVLSCVSQSYFEARLEGMGMNPLLLTDQFMYPGSFILHDAIEGWLRHESKAQIRDRAGRAYAKNQKISVSAAKGVFAELD